MNQTPPVDELLNAFEFAAVAKGALEAASFAEISGGDRSLFDRITFRPRMMVNTSNLDLTLDLFGQKMFAPIIVGPISDQKRFHAEGELAMVRGASGAKTAMLVSSRSSFPVDQIAAQAKAALWYQVYPDAAMATRAQQAVKCGCKAICLTVGATKEKSDWKAIDHLRDAVGVPVLLKGIRSAGEAMAALDHGIQGIVISNYTGSSDSGTASVDLLGPIVKAIGGKVPVLIDGSFRRGSDILKALALGARAVMLGRPPLWALAPYGAPGVQKLLELLQTELARDMAMCGCPNLASITPAIVKVHRA